MILSESAYADALAVLSAVPAGLITDIDGTISAIVARPEAATVTDSVKLSLARLADALALVAVVTARDEAVAREMVGVERLTYVGSYALDQDNRASWSSEALDTAQRAVEARLDALPCVRLEEKDVAFSLHYRGCEDAAAARRALLDIVRPIAAAHGARVVEGKQVIELLPASLPDKGHAVGRLIDASGLKGLVYLGDDLGDVAVFREIRRRREVDGLSALGIAVIDAETDEVVREAADVGVHGTGEVEELLARLAGTLQGRGEAQ